MKPVIKQMLRDCGIFTYEKAGQFDFRIDPKPNAMVHEFGELIHALTTARSRRAPALAHLILLDLLNPLELESILNKPMLVHRMREFLVLECDGAPDNLKPFRLALHDLSATCVDQGITFTSQDVSDLKAWLEDVWPGWKQVEYDWLKQLRLRQVRWAFEHLSPPVFTWFCGLMPIAQLRLIDLSSVDSGLVPQFEDNPVTHALGVVKAELLDMVSEAQERGRHESSLVKEALECLQIHPDAAKHEHVSQWLGRLNQIVFKARSASTLTQLVIAWVMDVVEAGTQVKGLRSAATTRRRYVISVAEKILNECKNLSADPSDWTEDARRRAYQRIVLSAKPREQRIASAALSTFQRLLLAEFSLEPIWYIHPKQLSPVMPRAQYVSASAMARCLDWIRLEPMEDEALRLRLAVAMTLGASAPLRVDEIFKIQMHNVHSLPDQTFEIEITGIRGRSSLKTTAALRRALITEPSACATLRALVDSRLKAGATSRELLFGHHLNGMKPYKQHVTHRLLLALLKAATGDPKMTFHALRHTWACDQLLKVFQTKSAVYFDRLFAIAEKMGHSGVHTTLLHYFHLPEFALRANIDSATRGRLNLTCFSGEIYSQLSSATIRQRARRYGQSITSVCLADVSFNLAKKYYADIASKHGLLAPTSPSLSSKSASYLSPRVVLDALMLRSTEQFTTETIAHRVGLDHDVLHELIRAVDRYEADFKKVKYAQHGDAKSSRFKPFRYRTANASKYAPLRKSLSSQCAQSEAVRNGVAAWLRCRNKNGYIELGDKNDSLALLGCIKELGGVAQKLTVRIEPMESEDELKRQSEALKAFSTTFGVSPSIEVTRSVHYRRPSAYLVWPGPDDEDLVHNGSHVSTTGLDAIFMAIAAYLNVIGELA
jgi:integrase